MMKITKVKVARKSYGTKALTSHCYFFPAKENIIDDMQNRRSRPYKIYRSLLKDVFAKTQFKALWECGYLNANWSQNCGCSCGCSPGFRISGLYGYDVFVDVEVDTENA